MAKQQFTQLRTQQLKLNGSDASDRVSTRPLGVLVLLDATSAAGENTEVKQFVRSVTQYDLLRRSGTTPVFRRGAPQLSHCLLGPDKSLYTMRLSPHSAAPRGADFSDLPEEE